MATGDASPLKQAEASRDMNQLAKAIVDISISEAPPDDPLPADDVKNPQPSPLAA